MLRRFAATARFPRTRGLSNAPPDPHAPLREQEVTSRAMLKKLRAAAPPPPAVIPGAPPPPAHYAAPPPQGQQPSFGGWMVANMVQGFGITLGFVLVLSIFRAVGLMEGGAPPTAAKAGIVLRRGGGASAQEGELL